MATVSFTNGRLCGRGEGADSAGHHSAPEPEVEQIHDRCVNRPPRCRTERRLIVPALLVVVIVIALTSAIVLIRPIRFIVRIADIAAVIVRRTVGRASTTVTRHSGLFSSRLTRQ